MGQTLSELAEKKEKGKGKEKEKEKEKGQGKAKEHEEKEITPTFEFDSNPTKKKKKDLYGFDASLFGTTVRKGFSKLYEDSFLSDISLVIGDGQELPCHCIVLASWSDAFRSILEKGKEKRPKEEGAPEVELSADTGLPKKIKVEIEPKDRENFKHMLKYMYCGSTDFITPENVVELLTMADHYGVSALKEVCGGLLGATINEDNFSYLLDISNKIECRSLGEACGRFLAQTFSDRIKEESKMLFALSLSIWVGLLKSDELKCKSETDVFQAVLDYADQSSEDPQRRDQILEALLPHVRFPLMSATYLAKKVETNKSINHLRVLHESLYKAYRYKVTRAKCGRLGAHRRYFHRFDPEQCADSIQISEDGMTAKPTTSNWVSVRCSSPYNSQQDYFEFKLLDTYMMIGVVSETCPLTGSYAGSYANGWTMHYDGNIYHASGSTYTGIGFGTGDRIGMKVNIKKGTMQFYKNGATHGTEVASLPTDKPIFPIVSFSQSGAGVQFTPEITEPTTAV